MTTQFYIYALVYMMVQAVLFGVGTVFILATPLIEDAFVLMPVMVVATLLLSIPITWVIALKVRLSNDHTLVHWQQRALND